MSSSLVQGFTKSMVMNLLSEIGDRTFCAAAILAMRNPRRTVFAGCLLSSIVMTTISALLGWAAPNLVKITWLRKTLLPSFCYKSLGNGLITSQLCCFLPLVFGLCGMVIMKKISISTNSEGEELEEVEKELEAVSKKGKKGDDDHLKKENQPVLAKFFSPVFLKAFSITLFGEWGDKSQLATIGLATDVDALSVILGGVTGQALCILAAVLGGKGLASKISEKMVAFASGVLFIIFGIQSFLSITE